MQSADGMHRTDGGPQHFVGSHKLHPVSNPFVSAEGVMADYADIAVRGSVENVRNLVTQAFAANGFRVTWASATKGKAEKGSKGMNIAFGALAQYYAVEFEIFPAPDGS